MVHAAAGEQEAGFQVVRLQVRHFVEDLLCGQAGGEQVKDIDDTDAHPPDAWATATLFRVEGDAGEECVNFHLEAFQ